MKPQQLDQYRRHLEQLLDRVTREVNHVVESIHEGLDAPKQESYAPVHLADFVSEAVDADVQILQTERHLRDQIRTALARIDQGTFGQCQSCGGEIAAARLQAMPYAALCVECAQNTEATAAGGSAIDRSTIRLTGFEAIEYAEHAGLTLNKTAGSIDEVSRGLTIAEAEAIADDDPDAIWLEVPSDEYYGQPRNMEPGTEASPAPRRAGQRRDELAPGQDSGSAARDRGAIGTPGGGLAAGGLAGTNAPDGDAEAGELEEAMASGRSDHSGDREATDEPQSGRAGGAVGGTPAGKRTRGR
jgi:RNA polymerase-binding protein DksA